MVAREHPQGEARCGLLSPGVETLAAHRGVLKAAANSDGAAEWWLRGVGVGLTESEIGTQRGKHQVQQFRVFQLGLRRAITAAQRLQELLVRQISLRFIPIRYLGSAAPGDKEVDRLQAMI